MSDTSAATVSQHIPPKVRSGPMSRGLAFAVVTMMLVVFSVAASAPSPLYVVYQKEWGFTSTTLTVVFAVYVVGMLLSMLMVGGLSDHVGRLPVLFAAIVVEIAAMALFIAAGDVAVLVIARIAQGVATGAAMTTLGATLVDFNPQHAPTRAGVVNGSAPVAGIALGALGAGALVQYGPAPTKFVYERWPARRRYRTDPDWRRGDHRGPGRRWHGLPGSGSEGPASRSSGHSPA